MKTYTALLSADRPASREDTPNQFSSDTHLRWSAINSKAEFLNGLSSII